MKARTLHESNIRAHSTPYPTGGLQANAYDPQHYGALSSGDTAILLELHYNRCHACCQRAGGLRNETTPKIKKSSEFRSYPFKNPRVS